MAENLVSVGEVIVNGVLFDPKNREALRTMDVEGLYKSIPRLFALLGERDVDYVLVGGIAMLVYIEGRNTQDIDLIVSPSDLAKIPEITIEDRNQEFARGRLGELQIDLLLTNSKLFACVKRKHSVAKRFAEHDVPCATPEGLLLLKLFALPSLYRQGKFAKVRAYEKDVADLIEGFRAPMQSLLDELSGHLPDSDLDEIRRIVAEIEERIARQAQRFSDGP